MAKPRIQSRVDNHLKNEVVDFAGEEMTESEAVRYLVQSGLRAEKEPVATDGGQVAERLDAIEKRQVRQNRTSNVLSALLIASLLFVSLYLSGALGPGKVLVGGLLLLLALVPTLAYSQMIGGTDE